MPEALRMVLHVLALLLLLLLVKSAHTCLGVTEIVIAEAKPATLAPAGCSSPCTALSKALLLMLLGLSIASCHDML
jgi:hypothetical protein